MGASSLPTGTVTFLFSDVEESTELVRRLGSEVFAAIRADHRRLLRDAFSAHGGHEIDTAGDGFFVAFDSARTGVVAAIEAQRALAEFSWPEGAEIRVRIGIHTAEPHLAGDGYVGLGVHRASRICEAGRGGQILLSNATAGIVEDAELPGVALVDLGEHRLKGLNVAQRLFQLSAPGLRTTFEAPRTRDAETRTPGAGTFADYQAKATLTVEAHQGTVLELIADTVLAVFRSASDAIRAAAALQLLVDDIEWPPECEVSLSIVLHSGRWSGDVRRPNAGTAMYRLNRLARTVHAGQVLVSATTAALVEGDREVPPLRSLGERKLPDFDEPAYVYELVGSV